MGIDDLTLSPALLAALYADVLVPVGANKSALPKAAPGQEAPPGTAAPVTPAALPVRSSVAAAAARPVADIPHLGKNHRNICFVVAVPGTEILPAASLLFLEKMLAACHCAIDDIAIVNQSLQPAAAGELAAAFSPEKWLLSGVTAAELGIPGAAALFTLSAWKTATVLCLPPLEALSGDGPDARLLKKTLWPCLKQLFGV